jgi:methylated-DNA-[protein]-cysteine S-methyltransferase
MTERTAAGHRSHIVIDSPIGQLTLVARDGRLAGLYMAAARHAPGAPALGARACARSGPVLTDTMLTDTVLADTVLADTVLADTVSQLRDYFAGTLTSFDLPLALEGTDFQRTVWAALQAIPYGVTISYGTLARRIGLPSASRAVGLANGRNPVSIVVPCHRVVGADGSLTGYGGGLERKRFLLALEQRVSGQTLA